MKKILYVGLDVHKESIVVATALQGDTEVDLYGKIGGTLQALDKLIKKLEQPEVELRFVYEAGPCGYVIFRHLKKRQLMSYFGLTPSEYSSGEKRQQGGITKAGNGACRRALVEAAHHYRIAPRVSPAMQKRQEGQSQEVRAIALKAQQRLHGRYKVLTGHHKKTVVVIAALARELCGFVWAIACQVSAPEKVKMREKITVPETKGTKSAPAAKSAKTAATAQREYLLDATRKKFKK